MTGTGTYEAGATPRDAVRLLIHDTDMTRPIFGDGEVDAFLALERGSIRYAAADALDTMAMNQAYTLKVITLFDLKTDGAAVARALQQGAKTLRQIEESDGSFDWAEMVTSPEQERERIIDSLLRGQFLFRGLP